MSADQVPVPRKVDPYRAPHLTLHLSRSGPVPLVVVTGEVDADNAHLLPELVDSLTGNQSQRLVLDLAQVTYLSAAGVEALLRVRDAVTARAGELILRNPSPIVLTVLAGTRAIRGFHLHTTHRRDRAPRAVPGRDDLPAPEPYRS